MLDWSGAPAHQTAGAYRVRAVRRFFLLLTALALSMATLACSGDDKSNGPPSSGFGTPAAAGTVAAAGPGDAALPIILARDQRLLLRGDDGKERALIQTPPNTFPQFPVWSPDGKQIAYSQATIFTGSPGADWGGDIYVAEAAGGPPRQVWKHDQPGAQVQGLAWSPDGKSLTFGYWLTIIKDGKFGGQVQRLDRLDIATGAVTSLNVKDAVFPSLNRDGSRMAYMTQTIEGTGGLWVSAADGSDAKQVLSLGTTFTAILYPRISPDGSVIAFGAVASQAGEPGRPPGGSGLNAAPVAHGLPMDVWRVTVSDSVSQRLTKLNEDEPYPVWSCDGKSLTILATGGLYTVNADGTGLKNIGQGAFGGQIDVKCT
jgi:Tol biopolymer transport system component